MKLQRKVRMSFLALAVPSSFFLFLRGSAEAGNYFQGSTGQNIAIRYVKPTGTGNGTSWENASNDLQLMINAPGVEQVWVAGGTYKPVRQAQNQGTISVGNRDNAFVLKSGVKVYGGFAGTETELVQRDLSLLSNASVLSGDLDNSGNLSNGDSFHVVVASGELTGTSLDGFTVRGGNAVNNIHPNFVTVNGNTIYKFAGGGIINWGGSPVFSNLIVSGNYGSNGGGMAFYRSSASIVRTRIVSNQGNDGGGVFALASSPEIERTIISGNSAQSGAGMLNHTSPSVFTNVSIQGNSAAISGGGILTVSASPVLINTTVAGNFAGQAGGGLFNLDDVSIPQLYNSIVSGNSGSIANYTSGSTFNARNSIIEGLQNSVEPLFASASSYANAPTTAGDYRLLPCSPAINTGSNSYIPDGVTFDLAGNPRRYHDGVADMGAYEYQGDPTSPAPVTTSVQKFCGSNIVAALTASGTAIKWYAVETGGSSLNLTTPLTTAVYYVSQTLDGCESVRAAVSVIVTPIPDLPVASAQIFSGRATVAQLTAVGEGLKWYLTETGDAELSIENTLTTATYYVSQTVEACESGRTAVAVSVLPYPIRYVKTSVAGIGDGSSWENASDDLQLMIDASGVEQVWVAGGTYKPIRRADNLGVISVGNRDNAFVLKSGVKVYGGFAGTETELVQRDLSLLSNASVLSGDLDNSGNLSYGDVYHVVIAAGSMADAELNGFSVRGGNAVGGGDFDNAIGVNDIIVEKNTGGGIVNVNASPVLVNLIVTDNFGENGGGIGNHANSHPRISNVKISGNRSGSGGGILNIYSSPVLVNVTISGNQANSGGGITNINFSSPALTNVLISGNYAVHNGGGIINGGNSSPILTHATISGNSAGTGNRGGIYNTSNDSAPVIYNSIIFGNSGSIATLNSGPSYTAQNSVIEGLLNSSDPMFVSTPPYTQAPSLAGDYRLQACSPAINAGENTFVPETVTTDLGGEPRIRFTAVDMGAYEAVSDVPDESATLGLTGALAIATQTISGKTIYAQDCANLIAAIITDGSQQGLGGNVTAKVWVSAAQPSRYVKRYYEIRPSDSAPATATVTLYFSNDEFRAFNQQFPAPERLLPDATETSTIEERKGNLVIEKRSGEGGETGLPENYTGGFVNVIPSSVIWNATFSRWEVTFGVNDFSGFFLKTTPDAALPVGWISFEGYINDQKRPVLFWEVDEKMVASYEVQRSNDARDFISVTTVESKSDGLNSYQFSDVNSFSDKVYYRIKQVDRDGSISFSRIISLFTGNERGSLRVYPNPVKLSATVIVDREQVGSVIRVVSLTGRVLKRQMVSGTLFNIDLNGLPSGVYLIQTEDGLSSKVIKD